MPTSKPKNTIIKKERNYSVDLLRIVAMLMIVIWHFLIHGGVLTTYQNPSIEYYVAWAIASICLVAVNCYVLISGYFMINSTFRVKKFIALALQVLFYSISIYAILLLTGTAKLTFSDTIHAIFPIMSGLYWFITAYICMYILSPFINRFIKSMDKRTHLALILLLLLIFTVWPTFIILVKNSPLSVIGVSGGYSILWFIVLYLIAAYVGLHYKPDYKLQKHLVRYVSVALLVIIAFTSFSILGNDFPNSNLSQFATNLLMGYNSVTIFAASLALFIVFINLRFKNKFVLKGIALLAPLTFGVYLIHDEPHVRQWLWGFFNPAGHAFNPRFILYAIAVIAGIYIVCSAIDWLRLLLFRKLAKMRYMLFSGDQIESFFNNRSAQMIEGIERFTGTST